MKQEHWEFLDSLADFTEDTFMSSHYLGMVGRRLRDFQREGTPLTAEDAMGWAIEREWTERRAGMLGGFVKAVNQLDCWYEEATSE